MVRLSACERDNNDGILRSGGPRAIMAETRERCLYLHVQHACGDGNLCLLQLRLCSRIQSIRCFRLHPPTPSPRTKNPRISFTMSPARQTTHALGRNNMRSAERRDSIEFAAGWAPHRYLHCSSHQYYSTCTSTLAQAQPPWEAMHPLTGSRSCATYLVLQHKYTLS